MAVNGSAWSLDDLDSDAQHLIFGWNRKHQISHQITIPMMIIFLYAKFWNTQISRQELFKLQFETEKYKFYSLSTIFSIKDYYYKVSVNIEKSLIINYYPRLGKCKIIQNGYVDEKLLNVNVDNVQELKFMVKVTRDWSKHCEYNVQIRMLSPGISFIY